MGNIVTSGPDEVMVLSGGCTNSNEYVIGGWGWAWWCVTQVERLSLRVITVTPRCEKVETKMGVALTVTGVAQIKVMKESELLYTACEQFLGRSQNEMAEMVIQTLEGHLRAILGTLTVEEVYMDREKFAENVREVAKPDVGRMGIEIISFVIKDVYDNVEYLDSLGRAQTAIVKRNAEISVAEASRDAGVIEAQEEKKKMSVTYEAQSKIADARRDCEMKKAEFAAEVEAKRADAELAYDLQAAKCKQAIRQEEIQIQVIERNKQIELESNEIQRKKKELYSTINLPAEAEAYKVQQDAEARKFQQLEYAKAEAEAMRLKGNAEAACIEALGKADAERMRLKADAYKQYGDAAKVSLVLDALPRIAAEVSRPLAKTDEILMLGDDKGGKTVAHLVGQVPAAIQALTGVNLKTAFGAIPGATTVPT